MSVTPAAHAAAHGDPHLAPHGDDHHGASHGSMKGYLTGFILSVVLTAIPFWLVMGHVFADNRVTAVAVMALAVVQIVVHMVYFLHMNTKSEGGWTMLALIFTMVVVVITLAGSIWVMNHLNTNMMPMTQHDMREMP
jgi:cytochrome o ubiquinol oxidase operon protein cyoD